MDRLYRVHGLVQGVGFRPYVANLANSLGLVGYVKNSGGIVTLRISGEGKTVEAFVHRLLSLDGNSDELPQAVVTGLEGIKSDNGREDYQNFSIVESDMTGEKIRMLPPDIATCERCKSELFDKNNRRYGHPFISCVSCGPRYSIMHELPYDRARTTMFSFDMCDDCKTEYEMPGNSRMFAQTICCNECGPSLLAARYKSKSSKIIDIIRGEEAFFKAIEVLKAGGVAAIKDIGGYHLAVRADSEVALKRLRKWKNREEKPFAVMFKDMSEIRSVAVVTATEEKLLNSSERPIVLLESLPSIRDIISPSACGDSRRVGAMLPCNPLQYLITDEISPLVMTSGNRISEPIITEDAKMLSLLDTGLPDIVLYHDREITNGLDDSIYQVTKVRDKEHIQVLRRARGSVPLPIFIDGRLERDAFACGGDLKSVFALARENAVYMSGHFGDLSDSIAFEERNLAITTLKKLSGIEPLDYICDKHPAYVSSRYAIEKQGGETEFYRISHHHAHGLSVMAEYGLKEALCVTMDGTGYGGDGNVWGGEFLLCNRYSFARYGHLDMIKLLGGDLAAKDCCLSAMGYLIEAEKRNLIEAADNPFVENIRYEYTKAAIANNINTKPSSSTGRLFDAVSAILGISFYNHYEGQSPLRLENCAEEWLIGKAEKELSLIDFSRFELEPVVGDGAFVVDTTALVAKLLLESNKGGDRGMLAYAFHRALAKVICKVLILIQNELKHTYGILPVVLSGGTFVNRLLLKLTAENLTEAKMEYYLNEKVPCGDGGLALGQIYALTK